MLGPGKSGLREVPTASHLVRRQHLTQEVGGRGGHVLELLRAAGAQDVTEDVMVHVHEIEDGQTVADRGSADLVAGGECRLIPAGQVPQEGGAVVAVQPFQRLHERKRGSTPSGAGRLCFPLRYARPSSRSSAVWAVPVPRPRATIVNATSGWMPTSTVSAPRRRAISASERSVRAPKESSTSKAATSMMTPRARYCPICSTRLRWNRTISASSRAVWIDAIRFSPCRKIETSAGPLSTIRPFRSPRGRSRAAAQLLRGRSADHRSCSS